MKNGLFNDIPALDLNDFTSGDINKKNEFVKNLGEAFNNIGFVAIKNHGLTESHIGKLYKIVQAFFNLHEETKMRYMRPDLNMQRGYTQKGSEHAKGRNIGDLKEFYQIGQFSGGATGMEYPPNVWPEEIPEFKELTTSAYQTLEQAGLTLLQAIALYLGLPQHYFNETVQNGNSILRAIHYYPITNPDEVPEGAVRAAEHGDINLITLLMGASADGLEILRKDGVWIPVTALPEQIVVNVGDMLARLTNDVLKSTIHRVVNPSKDRMHLSRYSIPFFLHPQSAMDLTCLESCVSEDNPKQYKDVTAGAFLDERLAEIGLKK